MAEKKPTDEEKENKLNKYLNQCYAREVGFTAIELAKQFCATCISRSDVYHHPLFHSCHLPNEEKIKTYAKEALSILRKSHLLFYHIRIAVNKKKVVKKMYFTEDEIETFIKDEKENPKKLKDVKKLAIDWYEE